MAELWCAGPENVQGARLNGAPPILADPLAHPSLAALERADHWEATGSALASPAMPRLVYDGKPHPVTGEIVLGRHRDCTIPLSDGKASRRHARIYVKPDDTIWVEDLESANGTEVNGEEIFSPRKLLDGDLIQIGKAKVRFLGDTVETTPANGGAIVQADPKELIGQLLGGYRIQSIIASGRLGTVYKANQLSLHREVAVKIFSADVTKRDQAFAERFLTEARKAGSVQNSNVVQVHECGQEGNLLWYSMELVEGDTLEDLVARDGRLDPALALVVAEQAAGALKAAHAKQIVHRDVNPANLMLSKEGKIKLLDLGLAQVLNSGRGASGKKTVVGNPWYMSPERAKGEEGDARSDIYSLGCVLYHLLVGDPPYDDNSPKAILKAHLERPIPDAAAKVEGLPKKIDELLKSMLSKNPEWRYASMDEVLADLKLAREALATATPPRGARARGATVPGPSGEAKPAIDHAAVAELAAERSERRSEQVAQHKLRNLLTLVLVFVIIGLAYSFSGIDLGTFLRNHSRGVQPGDLLPGQTAPPRVAPSPDPLADPAQPVAPLLVVVASPALERWKTVQAEIDTQAKSNNWGAAELRLARFTGELARDAAANAELGQSVRLKQRQLQLDGDAWYRQQIAALPAATTAANVAPRLARLAELRDVSQTSNRGDAELLYQELATRLDQQLSAARRRARQELEAGRPEALPKLVAELEPWFTGTPLVGVFRQFRALAGEAAAAKPLFRADWTATREALRTAKGTEALAAGAALILAGASAEGRKLLLAEPALAQGEALRRREALFGREAAILSFSELGDLQYVEDVQGDVRMDSGALTGTAGEAAGLTIAVPVGGENWNAGLTLIVKEAKGATDGQAVLSCGNSETPDLMLRIEHDKLVLKVNSAKGWVNVEALRPKEPALRIRLSCRAGKLQVLVNNRAIDETAGARIAANSRLRLELAGVAWSLDEVQVVGE